MEKAEISVVLVEPAGPLNLGSIARVMKNMELRDLILVNPHCDPQDEQAKMMAVHGVELLETAQIFPDLQSALAGYEKAIATTGRPRNKNTVLESPKQALPWLLDSRGKTALIFGPEDRGLNNEELSYAQKFMAIPSNPDYPSLNLAQAVAVCTYELYQFRKNPPAIIEPKPTNPAPIDILEGFYQHLETLLLKIEFLQSHTTIAKMEKLRRLFNRALPTSEEVALLRGIVGKGERLIKRYEQED
jgi:tRNA/rRNA methyltransferase